jgi:hypothetical protein
MTEHNTEERPGTPEPDENLALNTEPEAPQDVGDVANEATPATRADREARLRKRAQEAETERDQLRELVTGLRQGEVERRLAGILTNPGDVWHATKIEDLLDESGTIDAAKLDTVAETIKAAHPNWTVSPQLPGNHRPTGPIARVQEADTGDRWRGAFAPKPVR